MSDPKARFRARQASALARDRLLRLLTRGQKEDFEEQAGRLEFSECLAREVAEPMALAMVLADRAPRAVERLAALAISDPFAAGRVRGLMDGFASLRWPEPLPLLLAFEAVEIEAREAAAKWFWARERALDTGGVMPEYPAWCDAIFPAWAAHAEEDWRRAQKGASSPVNEERQVA